MYNSYKGAYFDGPEPPVELYLNYVKRINDKGGFPKTYQMQTEYTQYTQNPEFSNIDFCIGKEANGIPKCQMYQCCSPKKLAKAYYRLDTRWILCEYCLPAAQERCRSEGIKAIINVKTKDGGFQGVDEFHLWGGKSLYTTHFSELPKCYFCHFESTNIYALQLRPDPNPRNLSLWNYYGDRVQACEACKHKIITESDPETVDITDAWFLFRNMKRVKSETTKNNKQ